MVAHKSRNSMLPGGVPKLSRSAVYKKRALYKRQKVQVKPDVEVKATHKTKTVQGEKNGGTREVPLQRQPRFYPTEDSKKPLNNRRKVKPTKLRSTIVPGTVVIMLAGSHRGKRAVVLKQLPSGLLLVTGPYKINGVPLRRVDQAYVIATSTTVELPALPELTDALFKRKAKPTKNEKEMFVENTAEEPKISAEKIALQKEVDALVVPAVKSVDMLQSYLRSVFTLRKGQFPHEMKF